VYCFDNFSRYGHKQRQFYLEKRNFEIPVKFRLMDIQNFSLLKREIDRFEPDVIFHCAGQTSAIESIKLPLTDFIYNALGSVNVLEGARVSNCDPTIILCSTNKVYGELPSHTPTDEYLRMDSSPKTPYGVSKACADLYFQEYKHVYGMKTGVFRMSCIYGVRQFGVANQGWVAHFILSALRDRTITIYGDGKQMRDILWVTDLVKAFDSFVRKADKLKGNVFCMGGGYRNVITLNGLIVMLGELLNKDIKVQYDDSRPHDQHDYVSDIMKAETLLEWEPIMKPFEGINRLTKWANRNLDNL